MDAKNDAWKEIVTSLKNSNGTGLVSTWNWGPKPVATDGVTEDFLYFPNDQCATVKDTNAIQPFNFSLPSDVKTAPLALAANEPDIPAWCQKSKPGMTQPECWSYGNRTGSCDLTKCAEVPPGGEYPPKFEVTGCGMWPLQTAACTKAGHSPFPFECFGEFAFPEGGHNPAQEKGHDKPLKYDGNSVACSEGCKAEMVANFQNFYKNMESKGYTFASAPLVATDLTFTTDLLDAAKCGEPDVKKLTGKDRLFRGCPTHSAFHFYTDGCAESNSPEALEKSIEGFKQKVKASRGINEKYELEGTIVNEVGALTKPDEPTCQFLPEMMETIFDYLRHEGKGVVSQMMWFNENKTGGTYDLRLVGEDGKMTPLGTQYLKSCDDWYKSTQSS